MGVHTYTCVFGYLLSPAISSFQRLNWTEFYGIKVNCLLDKT